MNVERILPTEEAHDLLDLTAELADRELAPQAAGYEERAEFPAAVLKKLMPALEVLNPFPEMTFRAAAVVPPIVLVFPLIWMPNHLFDTAVVPAAFVPTRLPWTVMLLPMRKMPRSALPEIRLPSPAFTPPIVLLDAMTLTPSLAFASAAAPATSVPM